MRLPVRHVAGLLRRGPAEHLPRERREEALIRHPWEEFVKRLHCVYGTPGGGVWMYPPHRWDRSSVTGSNHRLAHFSPSSSVHTPVSFGPQARQYQAQIGAGVNAAPDYFMWESRARLVGGRTRLRQGFRLRQAPARRDGAARVGGEGRWSGECGVRNAPTGRDFAPPNGLRCVGVAPAYGESGSPGKAPASWPHSRRFARQGRVALGPPRAKAAGGASLKGRRGMNRAFSAQDSSWRMNPGRCPPSPRLPPGPGSRLR